jgi:threonine 3-dehydrogenase
MSNLMKALVKARPEPGIWMEEVPVPEPGPNDVLIRVKKSAICGTDVHIYNWDQWASRTVPVPMVVGHEFVGEIADLGGAVTQYRLGQRVSGEGHIVCGHCRNCRAGRGHLGRNTLGVGVNRPGSFAEYLAIPQHNVVPIPDDVPDEIAAILDPLGNAVHTALSFDLVGDDVLVTGAGPIGIMGALVAQCVGARKVVITDINPARLELARRLGVRAVVDASRQTLREVMAAEGMREGFDVGLELAGSAQAFRDMIEVMNNGG